MNPNIYAEARAMVDSMVHGSTYASTYCARVLGSDEKETLEPFADALGRKISETLKAKSHEGQVHVAFIDQLEKEMYQLLMDVSRNFGR